MCLRFKQSQLSPKNVFGTSMSALHIIFIQIFLFTPNKKGFLLQSIVHISHQFDFFLFICSNRHGNKTLLTVEQQMKGWTWCNNNDITCRAWGSSHVFCTPRARAFIAKRTLPLELKTHISCCVVRD